MTLNNHIHPDLLLAIKYVYEPNQLLCEAIEYEMGNQKYGACTLSLNNKIIKFRVAKITPKKNGQFVTLWKRIGTGPIMPYDVADDVDLFVVSIRKDTFFGQFVFPKNILAAKGIISTHAEGGKLAMRVYPPWDITNSSQAQKTQAWQLLYFVEIKPNINLARIKKLYT